MLKGDPKITKLLWEQVLLLNTDFGTGSTLCSKMFKNKREQEQTPQVTHRDLRSCRIQKDTIRNKFGNPIIMT